MTLLECSPSLVAKEMRMLILTNHEIRIFREGQRGERKIMLLFRLLFLLQRSVEDIIKTVRIFSRAY